MEGGYSFRHETVSSLSLGGEILPLDRCSRSLLVFLSVSLHLYIAAHLSINRRAQYRPRDTAPDLKDPKKVTLVLESQVLIPKPYIIPLDTPPYRTIRQGGCLRTGEAEMSQSLPGQAALESFLGILEMLPEMRRMILGIPE